MGLIAPPDLAYCQVGINNVIFLHNISSENWQFKDKIGKLKTNFNCLYNALGRWLLTDLESRAFLTAEMPKLLSVLGNF